MKLFNKNSQKLRHGSISIGIVAAVIAAVLLLNIGATALFSGNLLFLDMSPESYYTMSSEGDLTEKTTTLYSLMPETEHQLEQAFAEINRVRSAAGESPVKVDIIFCADPDMLIASERMRYVYYTALSLQKEFPDTIEVKTTNVWTNPSSVDAYRSNSYSEIYQSNIIISSGSEFRVTTTRNFYVYSEAGAETPWAYHGEKNFVSYILAVTQAEKPICALTTNHGEINVMAEGSEYSEFRKLLESAGYEVRNIDLSREEIPENCRLIVTLSPKSDFSANFKDPTANTEIKKLQDYLAKSYSYMIFADADTPKLPILEEYLEQWGIAFERYDGDGIYQLTDPSSSLDSKSQATNLIGQYETKAPSAVWTEDMREYGASPKVIFSNAIGIRYSSSYRNVYYVNEDDSTDRYNYATYSGNGNIRNIYDLFLTSSDATAYAVKNGEHLLDEDNNPIVYSKAPFRLMTITNQDSNISEGSGYTHATEASYVCAVGSVNMVSNAMLQSDTYGNADALMAILRSMGHEVEPVGLSFKVLHSDTVDEEVYNAFTATVWTVVLAVLPIVVFTVAGVYCLVRRKTRH